jgi:4-hydroxy-tetrahydrodipicolinate reductase
MGSEIARCTLDDPDTRLVGCIEAPSHPTLGSEVGPLIGRDPIGVSIVDSIADVAAENAVVIDFTAPVATMALLDKLKNTSHALVIGTTGLDEGQIAAVEYAARERPIVFSPNMSLGVNLLFYLTELVASKLGESFDIEIVEAHHRHKKDAPSGTARKLGEITAQALGRSYEEAVQDGRKGIVGERPPKQIGMHAVRGGDIVGDHTVLFAGSGERLELRHMAHTRSTFARGAVPAAKWVSGKAPGLYSMRDVLSI